MEFYVTKLDKVVFPGTVKAPEIPSIPTSSKFDIQLVSAKPSPRHCHEPSNSVYRLDHHSDVEVDKTFPHLTSLPSEPTSELHSIHTSTLALDSMGGIPVEYHEFHEVFSGTKANTLPPH